MYLHFDLQSMTSEQRALYVVPLQQLIEKNYSSQECRTYHDINCLDKLPLIHWSILTKVMGFLPQKAFDNTWEEVLSSNGLRLQAH